MPIDPEIKIDEDVLQRAALKMRRKLPTDPSNWTDSETEEVRYDCGPRWAGVPLANVKNQAERLRKRGKLGVIKDTGSYGALKVEPEPDGYRDRYLKSEDWKARRKQWLDFWEHRCGLCNRDDLPLDVHHRTYVNLGHEKLTDCIALCRSCHKAADRARQRARMNSDANRLFGDENLS